MLLEELDAREFELAGLILLLSLGEEGTELAGDGGFELASCPTSKSAKTGFCAFLVKIPLPIYFFIEHNNPANYHFATYRII